MIFQSHNLLSMAMEQGTNTPAQNAEKPSLRTEYPFKDDLGCIGFNLEGI